MLRGYVINGSPCVVAGGRLHRLPATHQPVREWAAQMEAWPDLCPQCGAEVCDCLTDDEMAALLARMARLDADPHGDLLVFSDCEIPY